MPLSGKTIIFELHHFGRVDDRLDLLLSGGASNTLGKARFSRSLFRDTINSDDYFYDCDSSSKYGQCFCNRGLLAGNCVTFNSVDV